MVQNIVDVSWDLAKFDEQTQAVLANMTKVYDLANQAKATGIKLGSDGGFTELKKNVTDFNKVQEQSLKLTKLQEQAEQARIKTQREAAIAAKAQEAAEAQRLKTQSAQLDLTKKRTAADEKAAAAKKSYNDIPLIIRNKDEGIASPEMIAQAESLRNAEAQASISAAEYGNSVNKSTTALKERGIVSKRTSAESIRDAEIKKQLERQAAQELKNSVREQLAAKGSLEQRRAALIRLSAAYDNLNATERNSASGVRLKGVVSGLTDQVKTLEFSTGRAQRNVGNYTKSVAKIFTTGYNQLRKIAYLIPGIGVGGLVLLLIEPVTNLYKWLTRASDAAQLLAQNQKNLSDVLTEGSKDAGKQVEDLKLVYDATQDLTLSIQDRTKAAKFLQDTYPDTFKNFTTEQIMVGDTKQQYDELAASIIKVAYAKAGQKRIEELQSRKLDIGNEKRAITTELGQKNLSVKGGVNGFASGLVSEGGNDYVTSTEAQIAANNRAAQDKLKKKDKEIQDIDDQIQFIIDSVGAKNLLDLVTGGKGGGGKGTGKASATLDSTKEALDAEFELYKIAQQRKIKLLDEEQNDNKKSLMERMLAAEDFTKASIELSDRTYQHEIDNDKKKLEVLKANYKKSKGTSKNNLAVEIDNATKEITIAQAKQNDARIDIQNAFGKKYLEIAKDTEDERLRILEEAEKSVKNVRTNQQGAIDAMQAVELGSLDKLLKEKLISQEEYNKRKAKFENDALVLSLQSQLTEEKGLRDIAKLKGESTIDFDNKIIELTGKLQSAQNGGKKPPTDDPKNITKSYEEAAKSAMELITGLVDIGYQKEIDAIQKIIDLNNRRKEQEIANINASTLSNQEKAAQMMILDNTVAANNKKLEREKTAIAIKQAKFDRDAAILGILENAAVAEFSIAKWGPAGIAQGIAIGIAAAAQIAMLLAKPLPQMPAYAKGTDNHPGGPAIVGEGGYKELVSTPDGKSFIADKPTFIPNLLMGSKVIPLKKKIDMINESMYNAMVIGTAQRIQASEAASNKASNNKDIVEAIELGSMRTIQAMKKQKGANVVVNMDSKFYAHIMKVVKE